MDIRIKGACENNLKNVNVKITDGLTVITGISGSGKSSLIFNTLFHEVRRRFIDVFSPASFQARLTRAKVEEITGAAPVVAVAQNLLNRNPGSTLATASGLHPFLRLLFGKLGIRYCVNCGKQIQNFKQDEIIDIITSNCTNATVQLLVPLVTNTQGSHCTLLSLLKQEFRSNNIIIDDKSFKSKLDPQKKHSIKIKLGILDNKSTYGTIKKLLGKAQALGASCIIMKIPGLGEQKFSWANICTYCGSLYKELHAPHFNLKCAKCNGTGCESCRQTGIYEQAAMVRWAGKNFAQLLALTVDEFHSLLKNTEIPAFARRLNREIVTRVISLQRVGLGYMELNRAVPTLSRGEAQRLRLSVILLSRLADMLHILDEPTIGQHPSDVKSLVNAFKRLKGPVIFVEHDRMAAALADRAIDMGPGAGKRGGKAIFYGSVTGLWQQASHTGRYFSKKQQVYLPPARKQAERYLKISGANARNLKNIDIKIPVSRFSVLTGVSGSGKSTLVEEVICKSLKHNKALNCRGLQGPHLKIVLIDQSPIGRNPRSNPATYTGLSGTIRDYFSRKTGFAPSYFSFNRPQGACAQCKGLGAIEVKMRYLPCFWVTCESCQGKRFSEQIVNLKVAFSDTEYAIWEIYNMDIEQARDVLLKENFFVTQKKNVKAILDALNDLGLGYLKLGQNSPTLSGGEAQRVKLTKYLGKKDLKNKLFILDEPSTGLHAHDINGLLIIFDRLVRAGATLLVIEHNTDIIRAADWCLDLGSGAGPAGGKVIYQGYLDDFINCKKSRTARVLKQEKNLKPTIKKKWKITNKEKYITIKNAYANNLKNIDVKIPKGKITAVIGVSGSGKSSLVKDILQNEANRRYLETLSMYERQAAKEGSEAAVESVTGMGVTYSIIPARTRFNRRNDIGSDTEIYHHLHALFAGLGVRYCPDCGEQMIKKQVWRCAKCGKKKRLLQAEDFDPVYYLSACTRCHGVGTLQEMAPEKLIIHPEKPLCTGAMYSPGFFPQGYLCKPYNGGYYFVQALARRYGFDPQKTAWNKMSKQARQAFLFGDEKPLLINYENKTGKKYQAKRKFPGFFFWIGEWDHSNTFTNSIPCPRCKGSRLKREFANVRLFGKNCQELREMDLKSLHSFLLTNKQAIKSTPPVKSSGQTILTRLNFLKAVGLDYINLKRSTYTLSAGEAQRIKLARLLGSELSWLTVLLDEPSRGLHPREVKSLCQVLKKIRDKGNTVIIVEHDPEIIKKADYVIELGPGAGDQGGNITASGQLEKLCKQDGLTKATLLPPIEMIAQKNRIPDKGFLSIKGARAYNLKNIDLDIPLGMLVGVCGVSGSGKSTLVIDTLGRALTVQKHTTSLAKEPVEAGAHDTISGAPARTIIVDQVLAGSLNPFTYLGLDKIFHQLYAESAAARETKVHLIAINNRCSVCNGRGMVRIDMGFLPPVHQPCQTCAGSGYTKAIWDIRLRDLTLPELLNKTINQVMQIWPDIPRLKRILDFLIQMGLGYLLLKQPAYSLSGGEKQRLKLARELLKKSKVNTLYLLDEPTVGLHSRDMHKLLKALNHIVDNGNSVVVIEHNPALLAACDWLIELGPGGGQAGGRVIAQGKPADIAAGSTPTALYLRDLLGVDNHE